MTAKLSKLILVCVVVGASGCDESEPETTGGGAIDKSVVLQKQDGDEKKKLKPKQQFVYSSVGKRDPFRSYLADMDSPEEKTTRPVHATEKYTLDQYRLTGLVTGTSQPKAMVEDPEGLGHTLHVGSRIGKNRGRVTRISASGVLIIEEFINPVGQKVRVPITLKLPEDPNALDIKLQ